VHTTLLKDGNVAKIMVLTFHADLCRIAKIERGETKRDDANG
jgi:hypothetical protein